MAKIVKGPKPNRVECDECRAVIEYLPEEVKEYNGRDIGGGPDGWKRVKCPRPGCRGYGYVDCW